MASDNDTENELDNTENTEAPASDGGNAESTASDTASDAAKADETPAVSAPSLKERKKLSAGERLAAAKAAKAAKKSAARAERAEPAEQEEEEIEDEVAQVAEAATSWVHDHQKTIVQVLAGAAVLSAVILLVQHFSGTGARASSELLAGALDVAASPVGEAQEGERMVPGQQRYEDEAARDAAALERYQRVVAEQPDTQAAAWAHLVLGRAKLDAGEYEAARTAFSAALEGAGGDNTLRAAALEGVGFSHEAEEHWDEAAAEFERLAGLGGAYEQVAALHQARVLISKGERNDAIERLQALIEALRGEDAPKLTYVRDQAELTLMTLDASLVQRSAPAGAGLDSLPPEILEQLLRQQGAR